MTEKEDFLDVDTPLPGQNWACISFVSPEKILKRKDVWMFNQFMKKFCEDEKYNYDDLKNKYDDFMYVNDKRLNDDFARENGNQTTVRGVKVRGCFETRREAEVRSEVLRRMNANHHIFVGQVGYWLPWDPSADDIADQKFQEESLNELVAKQTENQNQRDMFYEERKRENMRELDLENKRRKEKNRLEKEELEAAKLLENCKMDDGRIEIIEDEGDDEKNTIKNIEDVDNGNVEDTTNNEKVEDTTNNEKVTDEPSTGSTGSTGSAGLEFESDDPWMKRHNK